MQGRTQAPGRLGRNRLDCNEGPERFQVIRSYCLFGAGARIEHLDQYELGIGMGIGGRRGAVFLAGKMGVKQAASGHRVSMPEKRGIDIAEKERSDAEHRQDAPQTVAMTYASHLEHKYTIFLYFCLVMEVILIRHTSVAVPTGTCYGQTDVPLKDTFEEEAVHSKAELEACGAIDHAYTSPLSRCTRLAAFCGYPDAERDNRLLELDFGEWEMMLFDEITDPHLQVWFSDHIHTPVTGGESFMQQYQRVSNFLDSLRHEPYGRVVIFAHGGVLVSAMVYAGLVSPEEAFSSLPPFGGLVRITL